MSNLYNYRGEVARIVDGDTVDFIADLGFMVYHRVRLRLARIDTPEKGQPGFQQAVDALAAIMPVGTRIELSTSKGDRYGRFIAEVTLPDGSNPSDRLLLAGLAKPYS